MSEEVKQELVEKGGAKKKLVIIIGAVVAVLIIAGAGLYFTGFFNEPPAPAVEGEVVESATESPDSKTDNGSDSLSVLYKDLKPPFIVNFQGSNIKIMKIAITVMTRDSSVVDAIEQHDPVIRNNTLLTLASQDPEQLKSTAGKLALQGLIKDDLNKILATQKVSGTVEQVFFTDLVMQ